MAEISVYSRAHRAFRITPRFRFVRSEPGIAERYKKLVNSNTVLGDAVGVYMNPHSVQPEAIFVAEHGLLAIRPGCAQTIKFSEIESTRNPSAADKGTDISLVLRSGIAVKLSIAGRDGQFRDVFSFVQFLNHVLEDVNNRSPSVTE